MTTSLTTSKDSLAADSQSWASRAKGLQIIDRETCVNASQLLRSVKTLRAQVQQWWAPHIEAAMETKRKADAARKALVEERDRMEAPLIEAETALKRSLLAWEAAQERLRLEEEQRLQADARARAEAVTLAAAAALEAEALATGDDGWRQEADSLRAQPIDAPVVSVARTVPKVQGVSYRSVWKAHPDIDVRALAQGVADGTLSTSFLTPNVVAINQFARATQGLQQVAGVRFYEDRQVAARA